MLTNEELGELRSEMMSARRPIIFFDDDQDGLCAFLLAYRFMKDYAEEIKSIVLKIGPELDGDIFIEKIREFNADKVFILDKAIVSQDFLDKAKIRVIWVDHHPLVQRYGVKYFNPLVHTNNNSGIDDNMPTSYCIYKAIEKDRPQDMWIATVGTVSDWHMPEFIGEFIKKYPDILARRIKNPGKVLFETKLGVISRIFGYNMKLSGTESLHSALLAARIESPYEILEHNTEDGRHLYERYKEFDEEYKKVVSGVKVTRQRLFVFKYYGNYSITVDFSNELIYRYPKKFIIIARYKSGRYNCSFRSASYDVRAILENALVGIDGYGGGHEHACGGSIAEADFERFVENVRAQVNAR